MELGEPDSSGRRRPVPIVGEEFTRAADTVIAALSQEPDFEGLESLREGRDWIKADDGGVTKVDGVFAGGDALDLGLVTIAIFQGRIAAETIHRRLRGLPPEPEVEKPPVIKTDHMALGYYEKALRHECEHLGAETRLDEPEAEITHTLSEDDAVAEAARCMSCGSCFDCGTCWSYCQDNAIVKPMEKADRYKFKLEFCKGCKKCAEQCPCGFIEMYDPGTGQIVDVRAAAN
jgi:Pyruvate/2-oxoacid:ferredoxin oxidoreductase delta subunit